MSDLLRMRGWQVPSYPLPPDPQETVLQRVLARRGVDRDEAELLTGDMRRAIKRLEQGSTRGRACRLPPLTRPATTVLPPRDLTAAGLPPPDGRPAVPATALPFEWSQEPLVLLRGLYNGLPLDDRTALEQTLAERPHGSPPRERYVCYPDCASVPERSGVVTSGRSYTIAAGVDIKSAGAEGVVYAHGGIAGGHSLYVKNHRLHYAFNWVGTHLQHVESDREITPGRHVLTAESTANGRNADPAMPGAAGTLTLYIDDQQVASGDVVTQPGDFCVVGDGVCVGRDDASPVTPDYRAPFRFAGGTIQKVVVDVSGRRYIDHEAQVRGWFAID